MIIDPADILECNRMAADGSLPEIVRCMAFRHARLMADRIQEALVVECARVYARNKRDISHWEEYTSDDGRALVAAVIAMEECESDTDGPETGA